METSTVLGLWPGMAGVMHSKAVVLRRRGSVAIALRDGRRCRIDQYSVLCNNGTQASAFIILLGVARTQKSIVMSMM